MGQVESTTAPTTFFYHTVLMGRWWRQTLCFEGGWSDVRSNNSRKRSQFFRFTHRARRDNTEATRMSIVCLPLYLRPLLSLLLPRDEMVSQSDGHSHVERSNAKERGFTGGGGGFTTLKAFRRSHRLNHQHRSRCRQSCTKQIQLVTEKTMKIAIS